MTRNQRLAIFGDLGFAEGVLRGMKMADRTPTQISAIDEALSRLDRVLNALRGEPPGPSAGQPQDSGEGRVKK